MQNSKTHFEQVPLEIVNKIIEEQSGQEESGEQVSIQKRGTGVVFELKDDAAKLS